MFKNRASSPPSVDALLSQQQTYCSQQHHNTEKCTCRNYMQTLQECTELLGQRILSAVTKELEQFQLSIHHCEETGGSQDSDGPYWDAPMEMHDEFCPTIVESADTLLMELLTGATTLLLSKMEH